jgi:hypothetical protein
VAADLALRVLAGERPSPTGEGTTVPMFDDRQIKRWRIDRRRLTIDTQPQRGTEIHVAVPLPEARNAPPDDTAR